MAHSGFLSQRSDLFRAGSSEEPARYVTSHLELLSSLLYTLCGAAMMEVQNKYELFYN